MTAKDKKTLLASAFFGVAVAASLYLYRVNSMQGMSDAQVAKSQGYRDVNAYRRGRTLTNQTARIANESLARKATKTTNAKGQARFPSSFFSEIDSILSAPQTSGRFRDSLDSDAISALSNVGDYGTNADHEQGMKILRRLAVSPAPSYRMGAAVALSHYPLTEANTLLESLTHDSDPKVAAFATRYHGRMAKASQP